MKKQKLLVIDDDEDVLSIMEEALVYEGFEVKTAERAEEITTLINSYCPDAILIDYILKGINGGEICHQIKSDPHTSKLPVIILSAYPKVLLSLGHYGCDKFIAKPFDLSDLVGSIKYVLTSHVNQPVQV